MKFQVWVTLVMLIGISQMGVIPRKTVNKDDDGSGWVYIMHLEAVDAQGNPLNTCNCDDPFLYSIEARSHPFSMGLRRYKDCTQCPTSHLPQFENHIELRELCLALEGKGGNQ